MAADYGGMWRLNKKRRPHGRLDFCTGWFERLGSPSRCEGEQAEGTDAEKNEGGGLRDGREKKGVSLTGSVGSIPTIF